MRHLLTIATLTLGSLAFQAQANDLHNVIIGAATGAAGAAIGQSVGGKDGAIIGGAIGGATGAVIAAKSRPQTVVVQQEARQEYRRPRHGHREYRYTEYRRDDDRRGYGKAWGPQQNRRQHPGHGHDD
jgi:hypothetical protein